MSERPTPPPEGDGEAPEEQAIDPGEAGPTPSTWAGRVSQGGDAEEAAEEAPAGEHTLPDAPPPAEAEPAAPAVPEPARGETVESDTIVLGDEEAAQEAAHEALGARAAAHAAKHPAAPVPVAPAGAPPPVKQLAPTSPPPSAPPPATLDIGEPPKRGVWARFLAGAVLIIVSIATATAVSGLVLASNLAAGLGGLGLQNYLQVVDPGSPQTILILGSDRRAGETDKGRSDTTILLRVSPDHINLLSIPRDLKVFIPGHGPDKFNAAYTYGGPKLTLRTVTALTGLDVNQVVNINFTGFAEAVNEIGCVYVDVDHHYYHSNVGLATADQYSEINIPAGYQRMCGLNALAYVRYRHEDNDLVRSARQQAFLREARAQVPATKFINDYSNLTDIFTKYTTSTISDTSQVIGLARLLFAAKSAQVRELHFPGDIGGPDSLYVTASQQAVKQVVAEFLGTAPPTAPLAPAPAKSSAGKASGDKNGGSGGKNGSAGKRHKPSKPPPESNLVPQQSSSTLVDVSSAGADAATRVTKTKQGHPIGIPVYYPTKLVPGAEFLTDALNGDTDNTRGMVIDGGDGQAYYGYKIVAEIPFDAGVGYSYSDYFGFSGTNWRDAPILNNPTEEKTINGHDYLLFFDNGRLRQIGWRTDQGAYWVENDLLETLTIDQMLGMAESMTKYVP